MSKKKKRPSLSLVYSWAGGKESARANWTLELLKLLRCSKSMTHHIFLLQPQLVKSVHLFLTSVSKNLI